MAKKPVKNKKTTKKTSVKVKPEHYFFVVDGSVIKDLKGLAEALDQMSDDTFYYHVGELRNDFHNWTKDVLKEVELAEKLLDDKTRESHLIQVLKHIVRKIK
ncbi:hypothetical protein HQ529_06095 [Candidatus Woesearchaeota archaeon]|nr:hypothetical protein [Candidatus Woesearchaeota archaeon]